MDIHVIYPLTYWDFKYELSHARISQVCCCPQFFEAKPKKYFPSSTCVTKKNLKTGKLSVLDNSTIRSNKKGIPKFMRGWKWERMEIYPKRKIVFISNFMWPQFTYLTSFLFSHWSQVSAAMVTTSTIGMTTTTNTIQALTMNLRTFTNITRAQDRWINLNFK